MISQSVSFGAHITKICSVSTHQVLGFKPRRTCVGYEKKLTNFLLITKFLPKKVGYFLGQITFYLHEKNYSAVKKKLFRKNLLQEKRQDKKECFAKFREVKSV